MKITGQILRENRDKLGISINEVSLGTKINSRIIVAMETGDLKKLPPKTFLRGFVRAYAQYLNLDVENILNTFQEELGSTKPQPLLNEVENESENPVPTLSDAVKLQPKFPQPRNNRLTIQVLSGVLVVVLVIFIYAVMKIVEKYESEKVQPVAESTEESTPAANPSISTPVATPTAATPAHDETKASLSTTAAPVNTEEKKTEPAPEKPAAAAAATSTTTTTPTTPAAKPPTPVATPTPPAPASTTTPPTKVAPAPTTATPALVPKPAATPTPVAAATPAAATTTATPPAANKPSQELILEALDNIEIEYRIDGGKWQKTKLKPEEIRTIRTKGHVEIGISNGGAVNVIVNGQDRGVPGELGRRVDLKF